MRWWFELSYQEQIFTVRENGNFSFKKEIRGLATACSKIRVLIANDENWSIGMNTKRRERKREDLLIQP